MGTEKSDRFLLLRVDVDDLVFTRLVGKRGGGLNTILIKSQ